MLSHRQPSVPQPSVPQASVPQVSFPQASLRLLFLRLSSRPTAETVTLSDSQDAWAGIGGG